MSTYTDLHDRLNESLNVDYRTRDTDQEVHFKNKKNTYWGKFKGECEFTDVTIEGGTLNGVTLTNVSIPALDKISIDELGKTLSELSGQNISLSERLDDEVTNRERAINDTEKLISDEAKNRISAFVDIKDSVELEATQRIATDNILSVAILSGDEAEATARSNADTALQSLIESKVNYEALLRTERDNDLAETDNELQKQILSNDADIISLSGSIDSVRDDLSAAVDFLSATSDNRLNTLNDVDEALSADVIDEATKRREGDSKLEILIKNEADARREADINLKDTFTNTLNDTKLEVTEYLKDYAEHTSHMKLRSINNLTYPYEIKDFSVNYLKDDLAEGYLIADDGTTVIGKIENIVRDVATTNIDSMRVVIFADNYVSKWCTLDGKGCTVILNKENSYQGNMNFGGYCLRVEHVGTNINDAQFHIFSTNKNGYFAAKLNNSEITVGTVKNFKLDGTSTVKSCLFTFNTEHSSLSTFNGIHGELSEASPKMWWNDDLGHSNSITLNNNNTVDIEKKIDIRSYLPIYKNDTTEEFARIYATDPIKVSNGLVNELPIEVVNSNAYNGKYILSESNGFKHRISAPDIWIDYIPSEKVVKLQSKQLRYEYSLYTNEPSNLAIKVGHVIPELINKNITDPLATFTELSVKIDVAGEQSVFNGTYVLKQEDGFSVTVDKSTNRKLTLTYEPNTIKFSYVNISDGTTLNGTYIIDVSNGIENVDASEYTALVTSNVLFNSIDEIETSYSSIDDRTERYVASIDTSKPFESGEINESYPIAKLNVRRVISFKLPDPNSIPKNTDVGFSRVGSNFLITMFIKSNDINERFVRVKFVDHNGVPASYLHNHRENDFVIEANMFTTIEMREISQGKWLIVDLDLNEEHDVHERIKRALQEETDARIENDEVLANKINTTNAQVLDLYDRIKGAVVYKGIVNVIDDPAYGDYANNFHISSLFYVDTGTLDPKPEYNKPVDWYELDTVLSNGFEYQVQTTSDNISSIWNIDGVKISNGDRIIICFNEKDIEGKAISAITADDIDVIDATDDNIVTIPVLQNISSDLNVKIESNAAEITSLDGRISLVELSSNNLLSKIDNNTNLITTLDSELDAEVSRSINEDMSLHTTITSETSRAEAAESALDAKIDSEILTIQTNIDTEKTRAENAESILQNAIINEQSRAETVENALSDFIGSVDESVTNISSLMEIHDQKGVVFYGNLNSGYDKGNTRTLSGFMEDNGYGHDYIFKTGSLFKMINDMSFELPDSSDKLTVEKDDYIIFNTTVKLSDATPKNLDVIRDHINEISDVYQYIDSETSRAIAIENELDAKIDSEIARATLAESTIADNLSVEIERATISETTLSGMIEDEISRASGVENKLIDELADEISRATTTEDVLSGMIEDEISRATTEDNNIKTTINDEISRATDSEAILSGMIEDETSRAEAAESILDNSINELSGRYTDTFKPFSMHENGSLTPLSKDILMLPDQDATHGEKINGYYTMHLSAGTIVLVPVN